MRKFQYVMVWPGFLFIIGFIAWIVIFVTLEQGYIFSNRFMSKKQQPLSDGISQPPQWNLITEDIFRKLSEQYRDLYNQLLESWFFIRKKYKSPHRGKIYDRYRKLFAQSELLRDVLEPIRKQYSQNLSKIVFQRILYLQNPIDCETAKFAVCDVNIPDCGFGCQVHHVTYCFMISYALQRTLHLYGSPWPYAPDDGGFDSLFHPLGNTEICTSFINRNSTVEDWNLGQGQENVTVLHITPIWDLVWKKTWPDFAPSSIPQDLAHDMKLFHAQPFSWWVGQFLRYVIRPLPSMCATLSDTFRSRYGISLANFSDIKPLVGIHVRRTDKLLREAKFHALSEYAQWVHEYFDQLEYKLGRNVTRSVYIATDEIDVLKEANQTFPNYKIYMDPSITQSASPDSRYSRSSLDGILIDIIWLARSDFVVCTLSSNLCRLAYELMQTLHGDASDRFRSLDDIFFFWGQRDHLFEVVLPHVAANGDEIDLQIGDRVHIGDGDLSPSHGNYWNGYSKGVNVRTGQDGLFPTYKVQEVIKVAAMGNYSHLTYQKEFTLSNDNCLLL